MNRIEKTISDAMKELGRRGGKRRAANLTPEQLTEIAMKGVRARQAKRAALAATSDATA